MTALIQIITAIVLVIGGATAEADEAAQGVGTVGHIGANVGSVTTLHENGTETLTVTTGKDVVTVMCYQITDPIVAPTTVPGHADAPALPPVTGLTMVCVYE